MPSYWLNIYNENHMSIRIKEPIILSRFNILDEKHFQINLVLSNYIYD